MLALPGVDLPALSYYSKLAVPELKRPSVALVIDLDRFHLESILKRDEGKVTNYSGGSGKGEASLVFASWRSLSSSAPMLGLGLRGG
jgi:hypothetical protein